MTEQVGYTPVRTKPYPPYLNIKKVQGGYRVTIRNEPYKFDYDDTHHEGLTSTIFVPDEAGKSFKEFFDSHVD